MEFDQGYISPYMVNNGEKMTAEFKDARILITDKELAFVLSKYKSEIEMDVPHTDESELEKIIKEGMDLDNILKEEEEDGNY